MKRYTTVHHLIHRELKELPPENKDDCALVCGAATVLSHGRLKQINKNHFHSRHQTGYTQLLLFMEPENHATLPKEIQSHVRAFHQKIQSVKLQDDRLKTIRFLRLIIHDLNHEFREWNDLHKTNLALNLTILFIYGQSLILFNFGSNTAVLYRDGSMSEYNGLQIDSQQHYSLQRGLDGKMEYQFLQKKIPAIGELDFTDKFIDRVFSTTFRVIQGDIFVVLSQDAVDLKGFYTDIHIYEQTIGEAEMHKLLLQNTQKLDHNSLWAITSIQRIHLQSLGLDHYFLHQVKGVLSLALLLLLLAVPFIAPAPPAGSTPKPESGFEQLDQLPDIEAFQEKLNELLENTVPQTTIQEQVPSVEQPQSLLSFDPVEDLPSLSKTVAQLIASETMPRMATYVPYTAPQQLNAVTAAEFYYGKTAYASIIQELNQTNTLRYTWNKGDLIYLPVFEHDGKHKDAMADIVALYYDHDRALAYVMTYNHTGDKLVGNHNILLPPILPGR